MGEAEARRLAAIRRRAEGLDRFDGRPMWLTADVAFLLRVLDEEREDRDGHA